MPTTEAREPDEYEDTELPARFLIFTCPDLDQDEKKARKAGAEIDDILVGLLNRFADLEDIERALRQAESSSARARCAREQLLLALSKTDDLIGGVGNAQGALIFHWNTTTAPVSR
jgi:hypothetical protein